MEDYAERLQANGEYVEGPLPRRNLRRVRRRRPAPVTDGPFAETNDLIPDWFAIDVDGYDRALELAGELSAAPAAGGRRLHEWIEVHPFLAQPVTITE